MSLFLFFKNVYGLRVYGYRAAAKSATALIYWSFCMRVVLDNTRLPYSITGRM